MASGRRCNFSEVHISRAKRGNGVAWFSRAMRSYSCLRRVMLSEVTVTCGGSEGAVGGGGARRRRRAGTGVGGQGRLGGERALCVLYAGSAFIIEYILPRRILFSRSMARFRSASIWHAERRGGCFWVVNSARAQSFSGGGCAPGRRGAGGVVQPACASRYTARAGTASATSCLFRASSCAVCQRASAGSSAARVARSPCCSRAYAASTWAAGRS